MRAAITFGATPKLLQLVSKTMKKTKANANLVPKIGTKTCPQFEDLKWFQIICILEIQYCAGREANQVLKTGTIFGTQNENTILSLVVTICSQNSYHF